ncbi:helix-turn-helix domain-containing protein [Antarcticibacterium flavum]|uniref:Helix-turn-helix domain-containing protein n=1 Tax=Antarcticibacterium flavum TaxID=2058175 RepID=A0A5B7X8K9_9FLAO|nr:MULTISPECIES: helix-turn-helix domain-containing protein [Antarcticibacterium]MCM4161492.1 hypothetical protein [Antarcticibacterium sp. W02-3]QCY71078.1 helix-turn-helix domain-containing protein [Antarcticibacterium flavum]
MEKQIFKYSLIIQLFFSIGIVKVNAQGKSYHQVHLKDPSYQEIQEQEFEALDMEDWQKLSELVDFHISKAKAENNSIEIARAFYFKTDMEEPLVALQYADSIIYYTRGSDHHNYPTTGYELKGHLYFQLGNFPMALENYLTAYNLALEKDNLEQQREISLAIAAIRNINGQHYAAAELYKRSLRLLKSQPDFQNQHYEDYLLLVYNLALTHLRLQEVDSAGIYAKKGIEQTITHKDTSNYIDFVLLDAQINYYQNEHGIAKDTLLKYLDLFDGTSKAIKLYYLGKIEERSENRELAIKYFRDIDSIISITKDPFPEAKDVYQQLIMNSLTENDKRKHVEYIGKLIHYDSILSTGKENVLNMAVASYDLPYLKFQKEKTEEQLRTKERFVLFASFLAGIGSLSGVYFYIRTRRMKLKLKTLLQDGIKKSNQTRTSTDGKIPHPPSVPEDIRNDLLSKLQRFEESERFLCKDLDMATLAEELGTNTSYLSVVINHYKQMNFPNYLKELRISTAVRRLPEEPMLLKYSNQGLADTFGFKTGETFSKAFYKSTGVYPSKFINELKSRNLEGHL